MKLTNKLVERVGADKLLHCFLGGWIVSIFDFDILAMTIALAVLFFISFFKERFLDDSADIKDVLWAIIGGYISFVIGVVKLIIFL